MKTTNLSRIIPAVVVGAVAAVATGNQPKHVMFAFVDHFEDLQIKPVHLGAKSLDVGGTRGRFARHLVSQR